MDSKQKKALFLLLGAIIAVAVFFLPLPLDERAKIVLGITALAMVYWFTEAIPLHATALLVSFLLIVAAGFSPQASFAPYFDPVIVLLLGGFVLAVALQKHSLDEMIAIGLVNRIGSNPKIVLLGIMAVTAFLSFWMSNTAATSIMLPIGLIILTQNNLLPLKSKYGRAMVLGIAYAATIGGIGTLVGSTPNPMAAKFLRDAGVSFGFNEWLLYGIPFVLIFLPIAWFVLAHLFKPEKEKIFVEKHEIKFDKKKIAVLAIFGLTVALWLSSFWHGIADATIALVPVLLLYLFSLVDTQDFLKVNWPVLILIGGGLGLGSAMIETGIGNYFAGLLFGIVQGQPFFLIALVVAGFAIILTLFTSNTAAAALMLPLMIPLAPMIGMPVHVLVVLAAIGVSLDFIIPVGTPPSAIAYSSGYIRTKDMVFAGTILAVLGVIVLAALSSLYW